jgi:hypothetical protein
LRAGLLAIGLRGCSQVSTFKMFNNEDAQVHVVWRGGGFITDYKTTPTQVVLSCWLGFGNSAQNVYNVNCT